MQRAVILAALAALLCAAPVRAEAPSAGGSAKDLYLQGQKYYDLGEYNRAIELFKSSYEVEARPQLLFNIAQAYRFAGNPERAHFFYNAFLRNLPKAPNRAEVEKFIAMMAEAMKKQPLPSPSPSASPEPSASPSPSPLASPLPSPSASPVAIPPPDRVAAGTDPSPTPTAPAAPAERSRPIYKKWWFWAGIGALAAGTVAVVVVTSSGGGVDNPSTDFPTMTLFN